MGHGEPCRADRPLPEPGMRSDRGSVTIWTLGLSLLLLLFGGLALDFWRGLAQQRALLAVADSAAVAAASGIDEEWYRAAGEVVLDPPRAQGLAAAAIGLQETEVASYQVTVSPDGETVTVVVEGELVLGLLGVFIDDTDPLLVRATSRAVPRLQP